MENDERVTRLYVEAALNAIDYGYFDAFLPMFEDAIKRRKRKATERRRAAS